MKPMYFGLLVIFSLLVLKSAAQENLLVISVATEETDGYKRYVRSLKQNGLEYEILGLGQNWKGGDVKKKPGGGHKVNLLIQALEKYKNDDNKIILFTDSYDVIINDGAEKMLEKFKEFNSRIVFGAEAYCWPDLSLSDSYPIVPDNEKRYLNSGGFIGYASDIYEIITSEPIANEDDDQLFYTKIFLNKPTKNKFNIRLDTKSEIFQNLNGAVGELSIFARENGKVEISNNVTNTVPLIFHGNGQSKLELNRLGNYIGNAYSNTQGCIACKEDTIELSQEQSEWPDLIMAIFIEQPTPFLREFFHKISSLNYPKNKITILIHNNEEYHNSEVEKFVTNFNSNYASVKYLPFVDDSSEPEAKQASVDECLKSDCKYLFIVDSTVHFDNSESLKLLVEQNRPVLAPIMRRPGTSWSNIWGAVNNEGFYRRSDDYFEIIERNLLNVWNLPYVGEAVLVKGEILKQISVQFDDELQDANIKFASSLRENNVFMYATNLQEFGHLINPSGFNISKIKPEMFEIFNNLMDWTERYIHPEYKDFASGEKKPEVPCPDVYWFPILSDEFCESLITTMEDFGQWSGGRNNKNDSRIPGGYENVPTVDIHMTQVGFQEHWLYLLKKFVQPMQQRIFIGYYSDPPEANLNFVVRYRPDEQDHLTPHHDASTYTMNIALNIPDVDFQGGGVRFVRYDCSVTKTKKGWAMIHPGRLTHYHEGLKVTGGTRYIMVSFIDP